MDLIEVLHKDGINLPQDKVQWRALVNMEMNLWVR
jgi:hypothetical protein